MPDSHATLRRSRTRFNSWRGHSCCTNRSPRVCRSHGGLRSGKAGFDFRAGDWALIASSECDGCACDPAKVEDQVQFLARTFTTRSREGRPGSSTGESKTLLRRLSRRRNLPLAASACAVSRKPVRPLRGAHRQFVVDLSVFCRRGLCPPLGIAGRSRLLQDCPAGATFPAQSRKSVDSTSVASLRGARILWNSLRHLGRLMDVARALFQIAPVSCD